MDRSLPRLSLSRLETRVQPSASAMIAFGADAGGLPYVRQFDPTTQSQARAFLAYDAGFRGGVDVAEADVNGDGVPDIVSAAGPGGGPHVKLFDGRTGALLASFFAYNPAFSGGVRVAVGEVTGDGKPDIVTAAGPGGGPHVRVFDLAGHLEKELFAYSPSFTGGVNLTVGDLTGAGHCDIFTGAGAGGGPQVKGFDLTTGKTVANFFAYNQAFVGGVTVAAADLKNDGRCEIITGVGPGGGPNVRVFNGGGSFQSQFFAFDPSYSGGIDVGAGDVNGDAKADILVAAGLGGNARWRAFDTASAAKLVDATAFAFPFATGVSVAGNCPPPIAVANADAVIAWDSVLLDAIRVGKTPPPVASRAMAMMSAAVYDAVYSIVPQHALYHDTQALQSNADLTAAAAQAAHDVLAALFPSQATTFDADLATWLAKVPAGPAKTAGVDVGQQAAAAILAWRANDGSNATVAYTPGTNPGNWQPTPPAFAPALLPQWPNVTPFAMTTGNQFRPAGPPALTSQAYSDAVNQVESLGSATSTTRTADQTEIAIFWADGGGTFTPPGHWNQIAQDVSLQRGLSLAQNAQLFFALNIAEADAGIAAWDAKYAYNFWRPVTAIQHADQDGNAGTTIDPTWLPLLTTPNFPSYMSGHSTFSGAASTVLAGFFGAQLGFTDQGDPGQQYTRSFASFTAAADEAGLSRIYGGIHYSFDNLDGLATGRALGNYVVSNFLQ